MGGFYGLNADEVIRKVKETGVKISKKTLYRYINEYGVAPQPTKIGRGRGLGINADYPDCTPIHIVIAWDLINSLKYRPQVVRLLRLAALEVNKKWDEYKENEPQDHFEELLNAALNYVKDKLQDVNDINDHEIEHGILVWFGRLALHELYKDGYRP